VIKSLCKWALAAVVLAACGGDAGITEPVAPRGLTPNAPSSGGTILAIGVDSVTGASIETNKDDYVPGEVVHLVGRGWAPGETVNLHMTEEPNTHADVDTNVVADPAGAFTLHFYDVQTHDLGVTFTLTATGRTSNSLAIAVFTDGNVNAKTNSPSHTVTVNWRRFTGNNTCTGIPNTTGLVPNVDNTNETIGAVSTGQSLELAVPATSAGQAFAGWSSGSLDSASTTICVAGSNGVQNWIANYNVPPTANAGGPYSGDEGSAVSLNGSGSTDSDGTIASYAWTYSVTAADAGAACSIASANTVNPTITCNDDGTYLVKLTVTDNLGGTSTEASANLTVSNVAPTATLNAPASTTLGGSFNISLTSPNDAANDMAAPGFTYAFDCGAGYNAYSATSSRSCTGTAPSPQVVKGKIKDKDGAEREYTANVTINNTAPTANAAGPYTTTENTGVALNGTGSNDSDGTIASYAWTYTKVTGHAGATCSFSDASNVSPTITCNDNGTFTVHLVVTDNGGANSTQAHANLTVNNVDPTATFNAPASVTAGSNINLSLTAPNDVSPNDVAVGFTYAFDCGDGFGYNAFSTTSTRACPTTMPGSRTAKGRVRDKDNGETEYTASVAIDNIPPTANAGGPYNGNEGTSIDILGSGSDPDGGSVTYLWSATPAGKCSFGNPTLAATTVTCTDDGSFTLTLKVTDNENAFITDDAQLNVANVAPTIGTYTLAAPVSEGGSIPFSVGGVTDPSSDDQSAGFTYQFKCGTAAWSGYGASNTVNCPAGDGPGSVVIRGQARDKDGDESSEVFSTFTVNNVKPTITAATTNSPVNEGSDATLTVTTVTDPLPGDLVGATYAFACDGVTYDSWTNSNTVNCPTTDGPAALTIRAKVRDKDLAESDPITKYVTVQNVAPTVTDVTAPSSVDEGPGTFNFSATGVTDPSAADVSDGFEYAFSCNNGSTWTPYSTTNSGSCAAPDGPATIIVAVKAKDKDGGESVPKTKSVTVNNLKPTVTGVTAPASVSEGPSFNFSAGGITDPSPVDQAGAFTYAFSCNNGGTWTVFGANAGSCPAPDGPASINVAVKAKDKDGAESDPVGVAVTVNNVPPELNLGAATATINEGGTFSRAGSFTDPGADSWTATVNYGAGGGPEPLTLNPDKTFSLSHVYAQDGPYTVTVYINDGDGGTDTETIAVTVNNVLPTVGAFAGASLSEGGSYSSSGSFTDPGADTWTATVNYGDGTGTHALSLSGKNFTLNHTYNDDTGSPFTVTVTVFDDDGSGNGQATVIVANVAPIIDTPLTLPASPVATGSSFSMTWTFMDPGTDNWTCKISWDQPVAYGPSFASSGVGGKTCSISGAPLPAGVYTVTVYVSDGDGGTDEETAASYIVVYDPNGGFVTGGGWFNSVAGNYRLNLSAEGKANFGFVSKYQPGKTVPTGNTEFQFHAGDLNFKSTVYEWLVVAGSRAIYKGEGTIAGRLGVYGFLLSAIDGSPDKFRIKIWNKSTGELVYDTLPNDAADDADPATALGGGSIVVQTKK
jgi:hypothetical protein